MCLNRSPGHQRRRSTAPVLNEASALASQQTRDATSLMPPKRPMGIFDSMKSICCCVIWSKIAVFTARRGDAIHPDLGLRQFLAERFGEANDAGLRRTIGRGIRIALLPRDGSDVDDTSVAVLRHERHHEFVAVKEPIEVDVDDFPPIRDRIVNDRRIGSGDASAADQNVDLAKSPPPSPRPPPRPGRRPRYRASGSVPPRFPRVLHPALRRPGPQRLTRPPSRVMRAAISRPIPAAPPVTIATCPAKRPASVRSLMSRLRSMSLGAVFLRRLNRKTAGAAIRFQLQSPKLGREEERLDTATTSVIAQNSPKLLNKHQ